MYLIRFDIHCHLLRKYLDPKNIPSKHQTSGGMTGCLGYIIIYYSNFSFCEKISLWPCLLRRNLQLQTTGTLGKKLVFVVSWAEKNPDLKQNPKYRGS